MRELHYIIRSIFFVFLPNINAIVKGYPSDQVLYYFSLPNNPSGSVEELHKFLSEFQSRVLEKEKILQEVNQLWHVKKGYFVHRNQFCIFTCVM